MEIALCWGTVRDASFDELLGAAASAGFGTVMASPVQYFAERELGRSERSLTEAVERTGVRVAVVDALVSPLPGLPDLDQVPPAVRQVFAFGEEDCFRMAKVLGADIVNLAHVLGGPVEPKLMATTVAGICRRADERGLRISMEFMPNSKAVGSLADAARLVRDVGAPNLGIMFDSWHFFRSGAEPDDLADAPAGSILGMQVADAPAAAKGRPPVPLEDRLLPGDGAIPLRELIGAVIADNPNVVIGAEVISSRMRTLTPEAAAAIAADAVRAVLPDSAAWRARPDRKVNR